MREKRKSGYLILGALITIAGVLLLVTACKPGIVHVYLGAMGGFALSGGIRVLVHSRR